MAHGSFLVSAGQQMYLFGQPTEDKKDTAKRTESLFELVARKNGPLDDYNPQMLLQCLLWGGFSLI